VETSNPGLAQESAPYLGVRMAEGDQNASPMAKLYIQIRNRSRLWMSS